MAQLKKLCYSCSNVAILCISVGGSLREVCGSCYSIWNRQALTSNRNRVQGSSMQCYDNCGRPATVVMPQPTLGPHASMRYGPTPITQDVAVCSECADVRRLENLDATNPSHYLQSSQAEAMLERLAQDRDDFSDIPAPPPVSTPSAARATFFNTRKGQPLCPKCGIGMGQSANAIVWRCPQCGVQVVITP